MRIFMQDPIEAAAAGWRQDFAAIMFAYGRDPVGIQNSAFEKIQPSEELDSMQREKPLRQICKAEIESPKTALVSHMVNGQHGLERQSLRTHNTGTSAAAQSWACRSCTRGVNRRDNSSVALQKKINREALSSYGLSCSP